MAEDSSSKRRKIDTNTGFPNGNTGFPNGNTGFPNGNTGFPNGNMPAPFGFEKKESADKSSIFSQTTPNPFPTLQPPTLTPFPTLQPPTLTPFPPLNFPLFDRHKNIKIELNYKDETFSVIKGGDTIYIPLYSVTVIWYNEKTGSLNYKII